MDGAGAALIALLLGRLAYLGRPDVVLRANGYLQGGLLILFTFASHFMELDGPAAIFAGAAVASLAAASGQRRTVLFGAALLLQAAAWSWHVAAGRVDAGNAGFPLLHLCAAVFLLGLARHLEGDARATPRAR